MASKRAPRRKRRQALPDRLFIYGTHAVDAVVANPRRVVHRLLATRNAAGRLEASFIARGLTPEIVDPTRIDDLVGRDTVHQGIAVETEPLPAQAIEDAAGLPLVLVLDQVTDPHNVGACLRSAAAFGAGALIMTDRHAPAATGVLAKAASGALEHVALISVKNLARTLETLQKQGFECIGLDGEATDALENHSHAKATALVLGAEGKGLRRLTREMCDHLCRLTTPGPIRSLNVSNAAAVALHVVATRGAADMQDKL